VFIFIVLFTILVNNLGWIRTFSDMEEVKLSLYQIMIFGATMCASDSVAALTMIKADKYPKLFSVVFGEGMINDAVAIIIFTSVTSLGEDMGNHNDSIPFQKSNGTPSSSSSGNSSTSSPVAS
jgi:sodium/hydrogen exchanger-like protein 6/7/sodium/hydrogen exchanger 8